jgi:hypothetical protein
MSVQEQQDVREKYYGEAIRYMDNAKECLKNAKKEDDLYQDSKYVKMACGTAYSGLLVAMDGFLILRGIKKPVGKDRKSIEFYQNHIAKIDRKMLVCLNSAYQILHLYGYYDGTNNANVVREGFDDAYTLIEKIKPNSIEN